MAFSADELRVLRRALAEALRTAPDTTASTARAPRDASEVHDYLRLAEALEEAVHEGDRLRAFLLADLVLYRDALPGTAADYLERLAEALDRGYLPDPDDLAALRGLCRLPCTPAESYRREGMRRRCEELAERAVRDRLAGRPPGTRVQSDDRARLLALPGGRNRPRGLDVLVPAPAGEPGGVRAQRAKGEPGRRTPPGRAKPPARTPETGGEPERERTEEPAREPERERPAEPGRKAEPGRTAEPGREPGPAAPETDRRVPTPAEIWPPRRRGKTPPQERRAIV